MSSGKSLLARMARLQQAKISFAGSLLLGLALDHSPRSQTITYNGKGLRGNMRAVGADFHRAVRAQKKPVPANRRRA